MKRGQKYYIAIAIVVIVVACVSAFMAHRALAPAPALNSVRTYHGHGISFTYPDTYMLREYPVDVTQRYHYSIVLTEDTPAKREMLEGAVAGEGPVAIMFDVLQNNLDKESLVGFVVGNARSNFKLSDGTYKETKATRSRVPAIAYTWDGLYRGDSVVFVHEARANIVMASVTYFAPEDAIRTDFKRILDSVVLDDAAQE